jgi:hypothetical protein
MNPDKAKDEKDRHEDTVVMKAGESDGISEMISALGSLREGFYNVLTAWTGESSCDLDELGINTEYPFHRSFDELCLEVSSWVSEVTEELQKLQTQLRTSEETNSNAMRAEDEKMPEEQGMEFGSIRL